LNLTTVPQKHLILILARELASNLATPTLIADDSGQVVFYNEAAEMVIGRPFADMGEVGIDELGASFGPRTPDGEPREQEDLPARIALDERRAAHERVLVTSRDGVEREVSVTGIPLFAHADEFVGAIVFFWRE
jgi:PAS domain-containing protein